MTIKVNHLEHENESEILTCVICNRDFEEDNEDHFESNMYNFMCQKCGNRELRFEENRWETDYDYYDPYREYEDEVWREVDATL